MGRGFPKMATMTHKYVETVQLASTSGTLVNYRISCNGMYDPNVTGTGHQPYYFDQMAALYDHYCVIGAKITCVVSNIGAADSAYRIGLFVDDDAVSSYASIDWLAETQTGQFRSATALNARPMYLSSKWSAKKTFGGAVLANTELQGNSSVNPSEQTFWNFALQANSVANSVTVAVTFTVEYIAVWKEIRDVSTS